jgi:hypothetical protein
MRMDVLRELFHQYDLLLASPESLTSMAMRSTLAGAKLACIAGLEILISRIFCQCNIFLGIMKRTHPSEVAAYHMAGTGRPSG